MGEMSTLDLCLILHASWLVKGEILLYSVRLSATIKQWE